MYRKILIILHLFVPKLIFATDITDSVFKGMQDAIISAYGDFNSDELTDVFILRDDFRTIEILLASDTAPLLRQQDRRFKCFYPNLEITSVVPGDFDGDALMDVLFTARNRGKTGDEVDVYINYGGLTYLNCSAANDSKPVISSMVGEPLVLDYKNDMIIDLFGVRRVDGVEKKSLWIFNNQRNRPEVEDLEENVGEKQIRKLSNPHSHATIDMNDDGLADLCLSTDKGFEVWIADVETKKFHHEYDLEYPTGHSNAYYGQAVYLDMELNGNISQIVPVCSDSDCKDSKIWVHTENHYRELDINFFQDDNKTLWGFIPPKKDGKFYEKAITLRMGDFNNDGYPDLLATLQRKGKSDPMIQTFLLENIKSPNSRDSDKIHRTFAVRWNALSPFGQDTVMASFYDFYQDGILDVIMLQKNGDKFKPLAFRNTLDYDANFVKVIVLTGLENDLKPPKENSPFSNNKSKSYGSNLPGPKIKYHTTTQEGQAQHGVATQLPQSAYFSLHLPYQIFGLGRTPNFVDNVEIMYAGKSKVRFFCA